MDPRLARLLWENTINKLEAEFGSGVSDPFISGLVAMRAQNINYYSSLMENAPDDLILA